MTAPAPEPKWYDALIGIPPAPGQGAQLPETSGLAPEVLDAAADALLDAAFGQELPESPDDLARAAVVAAAPLIETVARANALAPILALHQSFVEVNGATYCKVSFTNEGFDGAFRVLWPCPTAVAAGVERAKD